MTADSLLRFIVEVQGEVDATKEDAEAVIDAFKHHHHHIFTTRIKGLAFDSFFRYLFSDHNAPLLQKVHKFCVILIMSTTNSTLRRSCEMEFN